MISFYKRAVQDIFENRFLNMITIITIALSILIVSAFILFFSNANDMLSSWEKGLKIMAYLKPGTTESDISKTSQQIEKLYGVEQVVFISKQKALSLLKTQMKRQSSILENLKDNPLPDALEVKMIATTQSRAKIEKLAKQLEAIPSIEQAEYGQVWIDKFIHVFKLFRLAGYALGGLFFMAAVFIVANTIRLVIYSRSEEIEIMRLVGAEDRFISAPFYFEGLIQGMLGGIAGLAALFITYLLIYSNIEQGFASGLFHIRFLSPGMLIAILLGSMFVGWLGCFISLKQHLKT